MLLHNEVAVSALPARRRTKDSATELQTTAVRAGIWWAGKKTIHSIDQAQYLSV